MKTYKKAAVYFSAGIGDALLLTPLIKKLKLDGYEVAGIFTSPFGVQGLYESIDILDEIIVVKNKTDVLRFLLKKIMNQYDISFVNFFAAGPTNLFMATITSRRVITNRNINYPIIGKKKIEYKTPEKDIHDGTQNLRLYVENGIVKESDFEVVLKSFRGGRDANNQTTIAMQFGTGNNQTPYKTWDTDRWEQLISRIQLDFPDVAIVLLGDKNEIELYKNCKQDKILNLCGKTMLSELPYILKNCHCFIGGDSGLMHLSAALKVPTFTLWGGSDEKLFNYHTFNPDRHEYIFNPYMTCRPCNSWINPNKSRVSNPLLCPDFICLKSLRVDQVYEKLFVFLKKQLPHA